MRNSNTGREILQAISNLGILLQAEQTSSWPLFQNLGGTHQPLFIENFAEKRWQNCEDAHERDEEEIVYASMYLILF